MAHDHKGVPYSAWVLWQHLKKGLIIGRIVKDGLPRPTDIYHMIGFARRLGRVTCRGDSTIDDPEKLE